MRRVMRSACKAWSAIPNHPWLKRVVGDNLSGGDQSVSDLMNQAMGYVTTVLASLWTKGQTLISIFSLVIITPVVAFYLICDWDRHGERRSTA